MIRALHQFLKPKKAIRIPDGLLSASSERSHYNLFEVCLDVVLFHKLPEDCL